MTKRKQDEEWEKEQTARKALEVIKKADQVIADVWQLGTCTDFMLREVIPYTEMMGALVWYKNKWWKIDAVYGTCYGMHTCSEEEYAKANVESKTMVVD